MLTETQRRAVLGRAVDACVREGYRLESLSSWQAVVTRRQRVRVGVNLLLTVVTAGFWLVVLALRLLNWPVDRAVLAVGEQGELDGCFSSETPRLTGEEHVHALEPSGSTGRLERPGG